MKVGILSFAHMHAWSYAECLKKLGIEIVGIYDNNKTRGRKASKAFGAKYYDNYRKLLKEDIQAVIVTSENAKHKELVVASAKAKKHILCEKPIATTMKDAKKMIEVCNENNVKLMIAFPCRFSPSAKRLKQLVEEGKLGKILAIKGTNHGTMPGGWFTDKKLAGGGAVMDHTVHVVDLIRWILKKEIKKVYAEIDTRFYKMDIDDCGILTMDLEDGIFATLDPSWSRPNKAFPTWGDVTMKIVGEKGTVEMDMFNQKLVLYNNQQVRAEWIYWGDNIDMGLIRSFIECIEKDKEPEITGEDGMKAMEVALAAYKSARLKRPVELPLEK